MEKIKIVNIIHSLVFGGTESFVYNYYNNMHHENMDVYILTMDISNSEAIKKFEDAGMKVIIVGNWEKHPIVVAKEIYNVFKKYKFNVVHAHLTHANFYFLFLAWMAGIKLRLSHSHLNEPNKKIKKKIKHFIFKILVRMFSTHLLACGEDAALELYCSTKNVYIFNNAIDLEKYKFDLNIRNEFRNYLNIDTDIILFGNIGRMTEQKNQIFLLDIFNIIKEKRKNSKLLIVGDGVLKDELVNKIKKLKLEDDIIIIKNIVEINKVYQALDCFIFPSIYEGLGMVLIEGQVSGLKCFASDIVIPNAAKVTNNLNFISLDKDCEYWANKIIESDFKTRKNFDKEIGEKGYDIKVEAGKLERFYIDIANERRC